MKNFFDKVLHKVGKEKGKDAMYINIGAMDGVTFDDSAGYVAMYQYKSLYVEPIPYMFERLKQNITDTRTIFENSAISNYDGVIQMLTIDNEPIDNQLIHSCFYGMSAVYPPRNGLASDGDKEVVEKYGRFQMVPCITLTTLFAKHEIENIDIMSVDTEGHDWKVLQQLDLEKYRPSIIRAEYINLTESEKEELCMFFSKNKYIFEIEGQNIDAVPYEIYEELFAKKTETITDFNTSADKRVTIVTGLWNLDRDSLSDGFKRDYEQYRKRFAELLKTPAQMYIYIGKDDEEFIWQHRSKKNTSVKIMEASEFETWFGFYDKVQSIRSDEKWYNQASWLAESPQAKLKYYNSIVMSKMFLLNNVSIFNPFESEYFYWIDAGISSTVHSGYFWHDKVFDNLPAYSNAIDKFLFISYPYVGGEEIHGFPRKEMAKYAHTDYVEYVCRGGFFGGKKSQIHEINALYYGVLDSTINSNLMGTEESIFTIISHLYTDKIHRFEISGDGLIWPFFEKLKDVDNLIKQLPPEPLTVKNAKSIIYILGFNSPSQFKSTADAIRMADPVMFDTCRKVLINNSIDESMFAEYDSLCEQLGFEEIHRDNLGVCGGRQFVAEHFEESEADFYLFFEDDMMINSKETESEVCPNGFRKYIPNLYENIVSIMIKENFDFLKLSFSEFYGNNSKQWAWYNVPQKLRTEIWPDYDKLPEQGLDPNSPKTKFNTIGIHAEVPYITGEVYYSNWPQIVSRTGNQKMFLDTKWAKPYEQTWMSHMFQETIKRNLHPGILLASPITHIRTSFYDKETRKES